MECQIQKPHIELTHGVPAEFDDKALNSLQQELDSLLTQYKRITGAEIGPSSIFASKLPVKNKRIPKKWRERKAKLDEQEINELILAVNR